MKSEKTPFTFDLGDVLARTRRHFANHFGSLTVSLPFFSFSVNPKDREKQIAREIVIRLKDRRVLSAWECCDNCIDRAVASLQEIRQTAGRRNFMIVAAERCYWRIWKGFGTNF
jgi:hypothetical protein